MATPPPLWTVWCGFEVGKPDACPSSMGVIKFASAPPGCWFLLRKIFKRMSDQEHSSSLYKPSPTNLPVPPAPTLVVVWTGSSWHKQMAPLCPKSYHTNARYCKRAPKLFCGLSSHHHMEGDRYTEHQLLTAWGSTKRNVRHQQLCCGPTTPAILEVM